VFALSAALPAADMSRWGWRIPFLIALPLGAIGVYVRSRIGETPVFEKVERLAARSEHPLRAVLGSPRGWKMLGRATLFNLPASVPAYLLLTFMPAYLVSTAHLTSGRALLCVTMAVVVAMIMQPIAGRLSDRLGRRWLLALTCTVELVAVFPAFSLLNAGGFGLAAAGLCVIGFMHGMATGCQPVSNLESFPTPIRYTGFALALGLSTALLSGPTPYIATWLVGATRSTYSPAWLIVACAIPALVGAFFIRETSNRPLPA
jgi:MHS family proline/betaine transporter-like MFS transporter